MASFGRGADLATVARHAKQTKQKSNGTKINADLNKLRSMADRYFFLHGLHRDPLATTSAPGWMVSIMNDIREASANLIMGLMLLQIKINRANDVRVNKCIRAQQNNDKSEPPRSHAPDDYVCRPGRLGPPVRLARRHVAGATACRRPVADDGNIACAHSF